MWLQPISSMKPWNSNGERECWTWASLFVSWSYIYCTHFLSEGITILAGAWEKNHLQVSGTITSYWESGNLSINFMRWDLHVFFPGYFLTPCDVKVSWSLCKTTPPTEVLQECAEVACDSIFDTKARSIIWWDWKWIAFPLNLQKKNLTRVFFCCYKWWKKYQKNAQSLEPRKNGSWETSLHWDSAH